MPTLNIGDTEYFVSELGSGSFAKAYLNDDDDNEVFLVAADYHIREFYCAIEHRLHLPKIEFVGDYICGQKKVFRMPFYDDVSFDSEAYHTRDRLYDFLSKADNRAYDMGLYGTEQYNPTINKIVLELAKDNIPNSLYEALEVLVDIASKIGNWCRFDFLPQNFSIDKNGYLILRNNLADCHANDYSGDSCY